MLNYYMNSNDIANFDNDSNINNFDDHKGENENYDN